VPLGKRLRSRHLLSRLPGPPSCRRATNAVDAISAFEGADEGAAPPWPERRLHEDAPSGRLGFGVANAGALPAGDSEGAAPAPVPTGARGTLQQPRSPLADRVGLSGTFGWITPGSPAWAMPLRI
jgi:hypothetical protein